GASFDILEQSARVGNAWHEHYDRLCLHTVKEHSHLPGLPFPDEYPRYVSRAQLADYYARYAERFAIVPRFGEQATSVTRADQRWKTATASGRVCYSRAVVVATGVNRVPHRPPLRDEERFLGTIIHSHAYRRADPFRGQRVLVVGMGNTGAEIALDLCDSGVEVALSVRGPVNIVPRDVLGRPTQLTALALARLPAPIADRLGVLLRRITVGDLSRHGIATPAIPPIAQLRLYGKTPVIDLGTVARIKAGRIPVYPGVERCVSEGMVFTDGRSAAFDVVIPATGYRAGLHDLVPGAQAGFLDQQGTPSSVVGPGPHAGLYFCGFDNRRAGGVLGTIVHESEAIANRIVAHHGEP
ncbi:MAG: flavin-containing monooxygenase, partial [Acidobacteriota bacterium]